MKIVIACGGSGGHIFPGIALASELKRLDSGTEILFIGSDRTLDKRIFEKEGYEYRVIPYNSMPLKPSFRCLTFLTGLTRAVFYSLGIIRRFNADCVVGMGGYVSAPVIFAAWLKNVPALIHEQNVVPGLANSFLSRFARRTAISFKESAAFFRSGCLHLTGNPIRVGSLKKEREEALKRLGLDPKIFTILVMGGSQGAHLLNTLTAEALIEMKEPLRSKTQVIHLAGEKDCERMKAIYDEAGLVNRTYSFLENISDAYNCADLAISRSGAATLFELAYYGRPMILVPYPYARDHQRENGDLFKSQGAALLFDERGLSVDIMRSHIEGLMSDRERLQSMSQNASGLSCPEASENLAKMVIEIGGLN
ncbi:MAG: undecaprenyldiphospho-muramoylpentapeptide beta-N-acetylglucosaminyltransferase [Candidatus Omnitrophica bacterium]|nr:undecaprenyldiphospho-muramoylpentapeptide beta-N-acetylglucosaminyltransferase [Candidatus Omnitrophota bacterium]